MYERMKNLASLTDTVRTMETDSAGLIETENEKHRKGCPLLLSGMKNTKKISMCVVLDIMWDQGKLDVGSHSRYCEVVNKVPSDLFVQLYRQNEY